MSENQSTTDPIQFKFIEFNKRRAMRNAPAACVEIIEDDGQAYYPWMTKSDIEENIKQFGEHPELTKALMAYLTQ